RVASQPATEGNDMSNSESPDTGVGEARSAEPNGEFSTRGSYITGAEFDRDTNYIEDRIVADPAAIRALPTPPASKVGTLGFGLREGAEAWPVEPGRYRLVAASACPWANRAVIVRRLLGLEDAISLGRPGPV